MKHEWHLVTAEYPPLGGGVADYTEQLAGGLVARGCEVHVWTSGSDADSHQDSSGATVHGVARRFGFAGLRRLGGGLNRYPAPRTIVLQYVPHAFGWKAMNVPLCLWAWWRRVRYGDDLRVMFHEAAYPFVRRPLLHNIIAVVNRVMIWILLRASRRVYVSTPSWNPILDRCGGRRIAKTWLPVPTNIADQPRTEAADIRRDMLRDDARGLVVGHFGTYGAGIRPLLAGSIGEVLRAHPSSVALLLGRGAAAFRGTLVGGEPAWESRIVAGEDLPGDSVAARLQCCDVALQPYPDGVSGRRTSAMAWLANGVPLVTNLGALSEPIWADSGIASLAPRPDPALLADVAGELLADAERRRALGTHGRAEYRRRFALDVTLDALLADRDP